MKDAKKPFMPNLITRLLNGGTLRRVDSHQAPNKKRGEFLLALDLLHMRAPRVHKY
ncbi:MAG: hypothetical protein HXY51_08340 [Nitrospirae bacterium]|nr:hypothetical protein [Nitrospirota bacterium]